MTNFQLQISFLEKEKWTLWDKFIRQSAYGSIFQTSMYLDCVSSTFQRQVKIVVVKKNNKIVAGVVLYPKRISKFHYFTLPYFIPYNGIFLENSYDNYQKQIRWEQKILELIHNFISKNYYYGEIEISPHITDLRIFTWNDWKISPSYTIKIPLQKNRDLLNSIRHNQRRHIQRFEETESEFNEISDVSLLFNLVRQSYKYHGIKPPLSREDFINFSFKLIESNLAKCFVIKKNNKILSAMLVVEDESIAYALFSGKDFKDNNKYSELYLHYSLMKYYQDNNYKFFDLLGAMSPSIARVKLELGGYLERWDRAVYFKTKSSRILYNLYFCWKNKKRVL